MIMNNYLKSELYRIIHSRGIYMFVGLCTAAVLFLEVMLAIFPTQYTTTEFAFSSMFSNVQLIMMLCVALVSVVFAEEFKNHTLKNSVAYGLSRSEIFFGRLFTELFVALIAFTIVIGAYIAGGYLLLADSGSMYLNELITGMTGAVPILILCVVFTHSLYYIIDKETTIAVVWAIVIAVIPKVIALLVTKVKIAAAIADWMPWYIISDVSFNQKTGAYTLGWLTNEGLMRCILVGIIGSVICYIIGLMAFKRKEIK